MSSPQQRTGQAANTRRSGRSAEQQGHASAAATTAAGKNSLNVDLPCVGAVELPPPNQLAFIGGLAVLIGVGLMEWPVGLALGVGHVLATSHHNKLLQDFGDALEEA